MEKKDRVIDGKQITIEQLPASYANRLLTKVVKYFGPVLPQIMAVFQSILKSNPEQAKKLMDGKIKLLDLPIDWRDFAALINDFASKLEPAEWQDFCLKVLAYTTIGERRIIDEATFNEAFTGKMLFMVKVLAFTLEANYGDFFEAGGISTVTVPPTKKTEKLPQS